VGEHKQDPKYYGGTVPLNARVEPELREALEALASHSDRTLSGELRQALKFYFQHKAGDLAAAGVAVSDVSEVKII
jgi:predicted transcriptional regulator